MMLLSEEKCYQYYILSFPESKPFFRKTWGKKIKTLAFLKKEKRRKIFFVKNVENRVFMWYNMSI